jgi:hypothetical protein
MSDYSPVNVIDKVGSDIQGKIVKSDYQHKNKKLSVGCVGKIVGCGDNVARNVAAVSVLLFGLAGVVLMFWSPLSKEAVTYEHWKYLTPLITASLGYLFGNVRVSKSDEV